MADYRLYFFDAADHIRSVFEFTSDDDAEASQQAETRADGRTMELWQRDRFVRRYERRVETS